MELADAVYEKIISLSKKGDEYAAQEDFVSAVKQYEEAVSLLPEPKTDWEAATWLYVALGDAYFNNDQSAEAMNSYQKALMSPGGTENAYIWFSTGQVFFSEENLEKAKSHFISAYLLDGDKIFQNENPQYFELIRSEVQKGENKSIGDEGRSVNFSMASRAINIEPDLEQLKAHDEYPATRNPLFYITLVLMIAAAFGTFALYGNGFWIWGTLLLIVTVLLGLFVRSYANPLLMKRIAYESGLLVPAILVNTAPLELIALADMRSDESQDAVFGCMKFTVKSLPRHQIKVGEKVPCVALFSAAIKGYRRHMEPRPVAWGYCDATIVSQAIEAISNDGDPENTGFQNEWEMLYALTDKMKTAESNEVRFFTKTLEVMSL